MCDRTVTNTGNTEKQREPFGRITFALGVMLFPISMVFLTVIGALHFGHTSLTVQFFTGYFAAASFQIVVLLSVTRKLVVFIWNCKLDPDNVAIPFVTAMGDLVGTAALTAAFVVLKRIGDGDDDVGD
eukprot:m.185412 g.185412  ORF g.185412 m.185412 type:complete len:128 (-) comp18116_c0_seq7:79-462(-)